MRHLRPLTLIAAVLATCAGAHAQGSSSGQVVAQMVLTPGCMVSGAAMQGGTSQVLGKLDFGVQPSTFSGIVAATASGDGGQATQIACSPEISALTVTVSGGNNPGQGSQVGIGSRAMRFGSSYLPYEVYSDAALTVPYATSSSTGVALPGGGGAMALPVYGRIHKTNAHALQPGTYADVLQVTLSW